MPVAENYLSYCSKASQNGLRPSITQSSKNLTQITRMPYPQSTTLSAATGATDSTFYQALIAEKDQEITRLKHMLEH